MTDLMVIAYTLKDVARPKRVAALLLLTVLPSLAALIWRLTSPAASAQPDVLYNTLAAGILFGFSLVLSAVVLATGVICQDLEQKTIVYMLTRPLPRWRLLLSRFVAALAATVVFADVAALLLGLCCYGAGALGVARVRADLAVLPVGAAAYGAMFLAVAALLPRPMLIGLVYAFGWESWVPTLPGNFAKLSLMSYIRILAPHPQPQSETVELTDLFSALNPVSITHGQAWRAVIIVTVVGLLLALVGFSVREYAPRDDVE